jgi:hypothetical protein
MRAPADLMAAGTREAELLLCCARVGLDPATERRVGELLDLPLDWDVVVRAAERHRLVPLLYRHLAPREDAVPASVLAGLRETNKENAWRSLLLMAELLQILETFDAEGIRAVPYKGPPLAQRLYGSVALRQMADLDILVEPHEVLRAQELLIARGYAALYPMSTVQTRAALRGENNLVLVRTRDQQIVELHWGFASGRSTFPLTREDFEPRLGSVELAGSRVPLFAHEDLLLILCFHGSRHMWERLEWITGVAELLRKEGLDWERVRESARRLGAERVLYLGLSLAHDLLDAPLPGSVLQDVRADGRVSRLAAEVHEGLFAADTAFAHTLGARFHLFQLRAKERLGHRLRYVLYGLVGPGKEDWMSVSLPDRLFPLYFLIRPLRLAGEYGLRQIRSLR